MPCRSRRRSPLFAGCVLLLLATCGRNEAPSVPRPAPPDVPGPAPDSTPPPGPSLANPAGGSPTEAPLPPGEAAVQPEKNPPGDIPDTQAFVRYTSPEGYSLEVPEGWARTEGPGQSRWVDKLDGVQVTVAPATTAPTAANAATTVVPALKAGARAVEVGKIEDVKLPAGGALRVDYHANSEPNPVTGKQVRLENTNFYVVHDGKLVTLALWAPAGADNVDQWERMSRSLAWP